MKFRTNSENLKKRHIFQNESLRRISLKTEKIYITENYAKFNNFGNSLNLDYEEILKIEKIQNDNKKNFYKKIFEENILKRKCFSFDKKNTFLPRKFFNFKNYKPLISSHKKFYVKNSDEIIKNFNNNN